MRINDPVCLCAATLISVFFWCLPQYRRMGSLPIFYLNLAAVNIITV